MSSLLVVPTTRRRLAGTSAAQTLLGPARAQACDVVPFETMVLNVGVTVESVDLTDAGHIVAICRRDQVRQAISILDLPLPTPPPEGAEWIDAYRYWLRWA